MLQPVSGMLSYCKITGVAACMALMIGVWRRSIWRALRLWCLNQARWQKAVSQCVRHVVVERRMYVRDEDLPHDGVSLNGFYFESLRNFCVVSILVVEGLHLALVVSAAPCAREIVHIPQIRDVSRNVLRTSLRHNLQPQLEKMYASPKSVRIVLRILKRLPCCMTLDAWPM
jgi:hypothetical protein